MATQGIDKKETSELACGAFFVNKSRWRNYAVVECPGLIEDSSLFGDILVRRTLVLIRSTKHHQSVAYIWRYRRVRRNCRPNCRTTMTCIETIVTAIER